MYQMILIWVRIINVRPMTIVFYYSKLNLLSFTISDTIVDVVATLSISSQLPYPSSPIKYWFYYYEITILSNPDKDKTIIAIGLASKNHPTNRCIFVYNNFQI